jgi:hypothetical protein
MKDCRAKNHKTGISTSANRKNALHLGDGAVSVNADEKKKKRRERNDRSRLRPTWKKGERKKGESGSENQMCEY